MYKKILLPLILLALFCQGCASMAINDGDEKLREKRFYEAARAYITALSYKSTNQEARSKLAQVANPAYDEKLAVCEASERTGNKEVTLAHYADLASLIDALNRYVGINFPVINARQKVVELRNLIAEEYYSQGERYFRDRDYTAAIFKFNRALHFLSPYKDSTEKVAESYYRIGQQMERERNYRQAAENFEKANQTIYGYKDAPRLAAGNKSLADEQDARRHYMTALEQANNERYGEAIKELKEAQTYVPHYSNAEELIGKYTRKIAEKEAEVHYQNGLKHIARENYADARKELEQTLALVPDYRDARELVSHAKKKLEFAKAQAHYEKGLRHAADGEHQKAADEFEIVLNILPNYKEARALAKKYRAMAEEKEARDKYQRKHNGNDELANKKDDKENEQKKWNGNTEIAKDKEVKDNEPKKQNDNSEMAKDKEDKNNELKKRNGNAEMAVRNEDKDKGPGKHNGNSETANNQDDKEDESKNQNGNDEIADKKEDKEDKEDGAKKFTGMARWPRKNAD